MSQLCKCWSLTHTGRLSWTTLFSLFWFLLCLTVCLFSVFSVFGCQFGEIKLCVYCVNSLLFLSHPEHSVCAHRRIHPLRKQETTLTVPAIWPTIIIGWTAVGPKTYTYRLQHCSAASVTWSFSPDRRQWEMYSHGYTQDFFQGWANSVVWRTEVSKQVAGAEPGEGMGWSPQKLTTCLENNA